MAMCGFEQRFAQGVYRFRWWLLVFVPALLLVVASGMCHLGFTNDYRLYFSEENPQLQAFEEMERTYSRDDNVVFLLIPQTGDVFDRDVLKAVAQLTEQAWKLPYSIRVDSLTNFQYSEAQGDDVEVRDLVTDVSSLSDSEISRLKTIALQEPRLVDRLLPQAAQVTAVNTTILLPRVDETRELPEVVAAARSIAQDIEQQHPSIDVRISGLVVLNNAFSEASQADMQVLVPASFGLMLVVLGFLVSSIAGVLITMLVIFLSILAGLGAGGYLGFPITPPSATAPTIILTVAIASSVHILVAFFREAGQGKGRVEAVVESLRINLQPVALTGLTTAIGFLTLNFSDAPPYRHLGTMVAVGVVASFVLSVTFLPALLAVLPLRLRSRRDRGGELMRYLAGFVVENRRRLLWGSASVALALIACIPLNQLNDSYVRYFDESIEFRRDADFFDKHLGGLYWIDYSLETGEAGGINEPAVLQDMERFATWLRTQPEIVHVNSLTDTYKQLNKNMHADESGWYRLPDSRELAAQYLLLYEMSLPYGLDLNNQVNVSKSATRIRASTRSMSSKEVIALEARVGDWLRENAPRLQARGASPALMFSHIGERNNRSMLEGAFVALVLISLIITVAVRSLKIGALSLVPNLLPAALGFGIWGLFVGEVGLSISVVMGMTLGIVVDDTIHFLSKYLRARREGGADPETAVRMAFSEVGWALLVTTLVLVGGFLVLALSNFLPNSGMGMLTVLVLLLALLADFFLLPTLLLSIEEKVDA